MLGGFVVGLYNGPAEIYNIRMDTLYKYLG